MGLKFVGDLPVSQDKNLLNSETQENLNNVGPAIVNDLNKLSTPATKVYKTKPTNDMELEAHKANVNSITTITTTAINAFADLGKTIVTTLGQMYGQSQETERAQINADAQISIAMEQTEQVRIQETENTKRVLAEYAKEIQLKEQELRQFEAEIKERMSGRELSHKEFLASLDEIDELVKPIIEEKATLNKLFLNTKDKALRKTLLAQQELVNNTLITLVGQIVALRK